MITHGTERNREQRTETTTLDLVTADGQPLSITYASSIYPYSERWCAKCEKWIPCEGLVSHIFCKQCGTEW